VIPAGVLPAHGLQTWSVSGEVLLVGEPPPDVKLAAFFTCCRDFFYASQPNPACPPAVMVSSVAALGGTGGSFTLRVDASAVSPRNGQYIYLILWDDANGNGLYEPGEEWRYVIPLYDDRLFLEATDCVYFYDEGCDCLRGTSPGWNQSIGLDQYRAVPVPAGEGARLSNSPAWEWAHCQGQGLDQKSRSDIDLHPTKEATLLSGD
jgi:hypothetical protein